MRCITGARFTMEATLLTRKVDGVGGYAGVNPITFARSYEWSQDGDSSTATLEPVRKISCVVSRFNNATYRSSGNNSTIDDMMVNLNEYLEMKVPAATIIDTTYKVTNIKDARKRIIYVEEEENNVPTIFNVFSVTPILDPMNRIQEKYVVLKRSEVQVGR